MLNRMMRGAASRALLPVLLGTACVFGTGCSSESGSYKVHFETTKGNFVVEVRRTWAPEGAERFHQLVQEGFYDDCRFFRVVKGFMVQFGINGDPEVSKRWYDAKIDDDPFVGNSNIRSTVTFATSGPNSRTTQVFINLVNNTFLDQQGFTPFGVVVEGMDVVDSLYAGYGDGPPRGAGPSQALIQGEGNDYLKQQFPELDFIHKAQIVP